MYIVVQRFDDTEATTHDINQLADIVFIHYEIIYNLHGATRRRVRDPCFIFQKLLSILNSNLTRNLELVDCEVIDVPQWFNKGLSDVHLSLESQYFLNSLWRHAAFFEVFYADVFGCIYCDDLVEVFGESGDDAIDEEGCIF